MGNLRKRKIKNRMLLGLGHWDPERTRITKMKMLHAQKTQKAVHLYLKLQKHDMN